MRSDLGVLMATWLAGNALGTPRHDTYHAEASVSFWPPRIPADPPACTRRSAAGCADHNGHAPAASYSERRPPCRCVVPGTPRRSSAADSDCRSPGARVASGHTRNLRCPYRPSRRTVAVVSRDGRRPGTRRARGVEADHDSDRRQATRRRHTLLSRGAAPTGPLVVQPKYTTVRPARR